MSGGNFKPRSLEERINSFGSPVKMLRSSGSGAYSFPVLAQYSSFPEEQRAWAEGVLLQDMGQHMPSIVFKGPDVLKLFSKLVVNSFEGFKKNKAKQFVFCRDDGYMIGDGVVIALEDDEFEVMGLPTNTNWLKFHIEKDNLNVTVTDDPPTDHHPDPSKRRFYRYQIQGPLALKVLEKAIGGPVPSIKFFNVGEFEIAGLKVQALSHTMSRKAGFEMFGPRAEGPKVLAALREAGREFGMRESGAMSLASNAPEAGWVGVQMTAIYTGDYMKPFREWVSEYGFEGFASLGGSYASDNIEDYYVTPWDVGYGHIVKFDHDFIGREALEKLAPQPHRKKVWLRWNDEDVTRVISANLFGKGPKPKMIGLPMAHYSSFQSDKVLIGDKQVGISMMCGYTVNVGSYFSVASIDEAVAVDGTEVEVVWGDADSSLRPLKNEPHELTKIRATVSVKALA